MRPPSPELPAGLLPWRGDVAAGMPAVVFSRECTCQAIRDVVYHLATCGPDWHYYRRLNLDTLGERTGYCRRTVGQAMAWLRDRGLAAWGPSRWPDTGKVETVIWLAWRLPEGIAIVDADGRRSAAPRPPKAPRRASPCAGAPHPAGATACATDGSTEGVAIPDGANPCAAPAQADAPPILLGNLSFERGNEEVRVLARDGASIPGDGGRETRADRDAMVEDHFGRLTPAERSSIVAKARAKYPWIREALPDGTPSPMFSAVVLGVLEDDDPARYPKLVEAPAPPSTPKPAPARTTAEHIERLGTEGARGATDLLRDVIGDLGNAEFGPQFGRALRLGESRQIPATALARAFREAMAQPIDARGKAFGDKIRKGIYPAHGIGRSAAHGAGDPAIPPFDLVKQLASAMSLDSPGGVGQRGPGRQRDQTFPPGSPSPASCSLVYGGGVEGGGRPSPRPNIAGQPPRSPAPRV